MPARKVTKSPPQADPEQGSPGGSAVGVEPGPQRLADALVARVLEMVDTDAIAAKIVPGLASALTAGLSLEALRERLLAALVERLAGDEAFFAKVSAELLGGLE